jgi:hypothetical protein
MVREPPIEKRWFRGTPASAAILACLKCMRNGGDMVVMVWRARCVAYEGSQIRKEHYERSCRLNARISEGRMQESKTWEPNFLSPPSTSS